MADDNPQKFTDLPLSPVTFGVRDKFPTISRTLIQAKAIPLLLRGDDLAAYSSNGSGKTLAYLIPALDHLCKNKYEPDDGIIVMVLCPNTMVAIQIDRDIKTILKDSPQTLQTIGRLIASPGDRYVRKNLLIATPAGLRYHHAYDPERIKYDKLKFLIFDDPYLILRFSDQKKWNWVRSNFPKEQLQIAIFSVTKLKRECLLRLLPEGRRPGDFSVIDEVQNRQWVTNDRLEQEFILVPCAKRLITLYIMLKTTKSKKVMVFFSTTESVKFHEELFTFLDVKCYGVHGDQTVSEHSKIYYSFSNAEEMILLCTNIAAFGLNIPDVDLIVQYDPPIDPEEYIHKVGRTARGTRKGNALLFLMPHELRFISFMKTHKVLIREHMFDEKMAPNVGSYLLRLVAETEELMEMATKAYIEYISAYNLITMRDIFGIHLLDKEAVAASFCLWNPVTEAI
ncbi:putative RNA helicase [Medicago truncatula]|uniref:ATP-dependent RNA helicase n=1 Tax=Medicago truncatula TaxID=3880 RepID=A0A396GGY0_MEDTR|nr:putative RNA helicase [Medicago truncatula]